MLVTKVSAVRGWEHMRIQASSMVNFSTILSSAVMAHEKMVLMGSMQAGTEAVGGVGSMAGLDLMRGLREPREGRWVGSRAR